MHEIVGLVRNQFGRAGDNLPFTYGFAVAFPDCRFDGQVPPSIQRELILDAARLRQVDDSVRRSFRSFNRPDHRALTDRSVESVRAALFPKYRLIPVMWRKIEDQEERLQRMTDDQQRILDILANRTTAAIQGVAGSARQGLLLRLLRPEPKPLRPRALPARGVRQALPDTGRLEFETSTTDSPHSRIHGISQGH